MSSSYSISNPIGYKILTLISMLYFSFMVLSVILTNRYVGIDEFFILGGTLISPLIFILDDIIAEIYGYKITRFMIFAGFVLQTIFVLICQAILLLPYPYLFEEFHSYNYILGATQNYFPIFIRANCGLVSGMGMPATKSSWAAGDTLYFRLYGKRSSGNAYVAHDGIQYNATVTEVKR